jgi:hypothetical protein
LRQEAGGRRQEAGGRRQEEVYLLVRKKAVISVPIWDKQIRYDTLEY